MAALTLHHIPVCPFSQRLEILLELKELRDRVDFSVVDITKPRDPRILELSGGTTALPVLELEGGRSLKESMVLLEYLEDRFPNPRVRRADAYERAVENLLVAMEGPFTMSGYRFVMNQEPAERDTAMAAYLEAHRKLDRFLQRYARGEGPWLFERFGWAELVYTPFFRRFCFVAYYEGMDLPETADFARVREWRSACLAHPAAQQVSDEEVIKLYYDYSRNAGNGALVPGRERSSFAFEPHWSDRPMPPPDKYGPGATDVELGSSDGPRARPRLAGHEPPPGRGSAADRLRERLEILA